MPETTSLLILITLFAAFATFIHGYSGFGFGLTAMTLFTFLSYNIERLSVVISFIGLTSTLVLMIASRKIGKVQWKRALPLIIGNTSGMPLGYLFLVNFGQKPLFGLVLGCILIFYTAYGLSGKMIRRPLPNLTGIPIGLGAGFIGGAFVSGGPPMVMFLYSQTKDPRELKSTIQIVFLFGVTARLLMVFLGPIGITGEIGLLALIIIPVCLPAMLLGHFLSKRHSSAFFKKAVYYMIGVFGVIMLVKSISALWL